MQPPSPDPQDIEACRALLRGGSKTFFAASMLLPRRVFEPASALYAFCRLADDAVDVGGGAGGGVAALRVRLGRAYDGCPLPIPADRALAAVVARHAIPRALPEALLEGFAWDAAGRKYETLEDLQAYAARVAGSVGAMMAMLMGAQAPEVVARACDLGVAMQFSNIARDVGEDARAGRLYLPLQWLREVGIDPAAWLARPVFCEGLGYVVARLLAEAEMLYRRARIGIAWLPMDCRPGIGAAQSLYAEIGREVARRGCDAVTQRAVVPRGRKAAVLARSVLEAARWRSQEPLPVLGPVKFLVDAVATAPRSRSAAEQPKTVDDKIAWLVDLFQRLDERQHVEL
jgi:phytoene synthase